MIDPACKLKSVIMKAFQNAAFLCEEYYNCAPDIEIKGEFSFLIFNSDSFLPGQTMTRNEKGKKVGLLLVYPPPHLYHILFELFKNSMRATVETHSKAKELPEIEVLLAKGEHDVSIRISDQVIRFGSTQGPQNDPIDAGRRHSQAHHRPHLSLPRLDSTQAEYDSHQSSACWLWYAISLQVVVSYKCFPRLWVAPFPSLCSLFPWRPHP